MNELNLLPNVAKFQASKMKMKSLVNKVSIYIGVAWVVILLVVFGFWAIEQNRINVEQRRFDRAKEEFESLKEEIVLTQQLKFRAKLVGEILDSRFEYHQVFKIIQSMFSEKVAIEKTQIEDGNFISVSGSTEGLNSFDEVQKKIDMINNKEVAGLAAARLKDLTLADNSWRFSMEVDLE